MSTVASTLDSESRPILLERLVSDFPASAEEWSRSVNRLNRWEEEHLLVDNPTPDSWMTRRPACRWAAHARTCTRRFCCASVRKKQRCSANLPLCHPRHDELAKSANKPLAAGRRC